MRSDMWKVGVLYGGIGALLNILLYLILYWAGEEIFEKSAQFPFIATPLVVFLMLRDFRFHRNGGYLQYWQAMTTGLVYALTIALITGLFVALLMEYGPSEIKQEYIDTQLAYIENQEARDLDKQLTAEEYARLKENTRNMKGWVMMGDQLIKNLLLGLGAASFIGLFMRKSDIEQSKT